MARVFNFSAGPAVLPEEVLREVAEEMLDYKGIGMSMMEMSHRSKMSQDTLDGAEQDSRELPGVPADYKVLFVQGGGHVQFAMAPLNLMKNRKAECVVTGQWAKKALQEATPYGDMRAVASSEGKVYSYIPDYADLSIRADADYLYFCKNSTIYGTVFHETPDVKGKTLVADVSPCFLPVPEKVTDYGIFWGGVQKNVGSVGMVIAVMREDLIGDCLPGAPTMLRYETYAAHGLFYNIPPCYNIYICGKISRWIKETDGFAAMQKRNEEKAALLYDLLDQSKLFSNPVWREDRPVMNVTFVTGDAAFDKKFVEEVKATGFENPKGHRAVGGMRTSLCNAIPKEGVQCLVDFMVAFEKREA